MEEPASKDDPPVTGEVTELLFRALEGLEDVDVDALCRARPEHAAEIRRRFSAVHSAVEAFRRGADSPAWDAFLAELRDRHAAADRYLDEGELARGGMGVVRRVFDRDLRRSIAMKRILDGKVGDAMVGRFLEEAQVAGQLDHPGIVPVHELGVDAEGRLYFTMKLVEGEHFGTILEKVRRGEEGWTRVRALGVLLRAAEAVAYAHAKGVVHRDLKPENVMVGRFGETYVMDWGLARLVHAAEGTDLPPIDTERAEVDADSPLRTLVGEAVGTPFFMAPEQAQGRLDAIGPATDVYAMGCVLYQLLTGRCPYQDSGATTSKEVIEELLRGPPARIRTLEPNVPPELEAICERAMDRRLSRRYRTMQEFADDLRAYQENRVVRAHATGPWAEFVKWTARNRGVAWTVASAGVLLVASTAFFVARVDRERRAAEESAEVAREVNAFLTDDLLAAVQPSSAEGRGRDVTMRAVLDEASRRIEGRFAGRPAVETALRTTLGTTYRELGEPAAAEPHLLRAVDVAREHHGDRSPEAFVARNVLALVRFDLGRYDEAEEQFRALVSDAAAKLGEDHETTLTYRSNLAVVLRKRGLLEEALALDRGVLERRLASGDGGATILANLNGLALLAHRMGNYEEAEELFTKAYRGAREVLGPSSLEALTYAQNLAGLHVEQGRGAEAEALYEAALEETTALLGPDHAQTLNVARNHAGLLRRQQRYDEAERRYRDVIERLRRAYGPDHLETIGCLRDYAVLLLDQDRFDEGAPLLQEALEAQRRTLGPEHASTLSTLSSLAVLTYKRGHREEAGRMFEELLARRRETLGDDHPDTLTSMENVIAFHLGSDPSAGEALAVELLERTASDDPRRAVREKLLSRTRGGATSTVPAPADPESSEDAERPRPPGEEAGPRGNVSRGRP